MQTLTDIGSGVGHSISGRSKVLQLAILMSSLSMLGCQSPQPTVRQQVAEDLAVPVQNQLKERLDGFIEFFQSTIEAAAADIERKSPAKEHRKAAALWRVRMIGECRTTAKQEDAREVLVDLWTLCTRLHEYLTQGDGKAIFGPSQSLAVASADKINAAFEGLVQEFVSPDELSKMRERIAVYSRAHPIRGEFVAAPSERLSDNPEIEKGLTRLVALPLAPLQALSAIGRTPESVRDVSKSVYRFSSVMEDLPASTRWQLQLLGMTFDESATVSTTVDSFKTLSDSSAQVADNSSRFVQVIDDMPQKIRTQAEVLLKSVDESQPQVHTTLKEAQKTATTVQGASQDIRETVAGVDHTIVNVRESAAALEQAANAVTVTAAEILKFIPSTMKDETGQIIGERSDREPAQPALSKVAATEKADAEVMLPAPKTLESASASAPASNVPVTTTDTRFSFQAVTESAHALGATTEKLQRLLGDLRGFTESGSLSAETSAIDGRMRGAVDFSAVRLQVVVDHAAKRVAQLLVLAFALVVLYRFGAVRLIRARVNA